MKFKGIPLNVLLASDTIPALPSLLDMYRGKKGSRWTVSDGRWLALPDILFRIALLGIVALVVLVKPESEEAIAGVSTVGALVLWGLITKNIQHWKLAPVAKSLERLDALLRGNGRTHGISQLPSKAEDLQADLHAFTHELIAAIRTGQVGLKGGQLEAAIGNLAKKNADFGETTMLLTHTFPVRLGDLGVVFRNADSAAAKAKQPPEPTVVALERSGDQAHHIPGLG